MSLPAVRWASLRNVGLCANPRDRTRGRAGHCSASPSGSTRSSPAVLVPRCQARGHQSSTVPALMRRRASSRRKTRITLLNTRVRDCRRRPTRAINPAAILPWKSARNECGVAHQPQNQPLRAWLGFVEGGCNRDLRRGFSASSSPRLHRPRSAAGRTPPTFDFDKNDNPHLVNGSRTCYLSLPALRGCDAQSVPALVSPTAAGASTTWTSAIDRNIPRS